MRVEFDKNGASPRWNCLNIFHIIVNEADDPNNDRIYYSEYNRSKSIVICEIPSLIGRYGTSYDTEGMQNRLRGLAERYKDDDGMYIVSVSTTHDLNSATIMDIDELMFQISTH
jgi:hypothetical protein